MAATHAVQVAQIAASAGPAVLLLLSAIAMGGTAGVRAFRARPAREAGQVSGPDGPAEDAPKVWPRVLLLVASAVWTGAQALRVSILWERRNPSGTVDFDNASAQFQMLACRVYVIAAYGVAGPATMLLLIALIRIALAANGRGAARASVAGTLAFVAPVAAAQALVAYLDTTPAFGDTRDQMRRGLPAYFVDVYISNARQGRMTDADAQCSWGERRYFPLSGEACVACIVPLFATIVAAVAVAVYAVCMTVVTSHVESSVINFRLRSRVRRLQRTALAGLAVVVATGGVSLLFKPGTLLFESIMLAHTFGVLCSCAAALWLIWPQPGAPAADLIVVAIEGDAEPPAPEGGAPSKDAAADDRL